MIQETSRESYQKLQTVLATTQWEVLEAFAKNGASNNREIAEKLGWTINKVTGRTRELVKKGCLKEAFKDTDLVTARTVIYWTLTFKGIEALNN